MFSITLVIGVTNESSALKQTVQTIVDTCSTDDLKRIIIVCSKAATRDCRQMMCELAHQYPNLICTMEQTRPYVGGGIQDGFDKADSTHIVLLPGDLAIELGFITQMIDLEKKHPQNIVKTSRWMRPGLVHNYPRTRQILNAMAQVFLRVLYCTDLTDLTNPVQIMPTALYRQIAWKELNFPFLIEMILCPLRLGVKFIEIPAECNERKEGKSNNSFWQTALYLKTALRIRFTRPEKLLK